MDRKERNKKIKELEKLSYDESIEYSYIIGELDKLLEEYPEDIEVLNFKADMLSQLGHKEEAKLIHAKVLSLNFNDKEALREFFYSEYKHKYISPSVVFGCEIFLMILLAVRFVTAAINDTFQYDIVKYSLYLIFAGVILCPILCEGINRFYVFKNCELKIPGFTKSYFKNIVAKVDISIAPIVGLVVGFILDRVYSSNNLWYLGICAGMFIGFLYAIWSAISDRIAAMRAKKAKKVKKKSKKYVG